MKSMLCLGAAARILITGLQRTPLPSLTCLPRRSFWAKAGHVSRFTSRNPLSFKLLQPFSTLFNLIFYACSLFSFSLFAYACHPPSTGL
jgi:hypothetical protein